MTDDRDYVEEDYLRFGMGLDRTDPLMDQHWEAREDRLQDYTPATFRYRCPHCDRSYADPNEQRICPDCGERSGVFRRREDWEDAA